MKNIILILLTIVFLNLKIYAQQVISLNNKVTLSLPSNAKNVSHLEVNNFVATHLNGDKLTTRFVSERNVQNMFISGNILVTLYPQKAHTNKQHLQELKTAFDAMPKAGNYHNSELKNYTNFSVLVSTFKNSDNHLETLSFFVSDNYDANDVTGVLEFNPKDAAEAKQVLDNILTNLKFKVQ